MKTNTPQTIDNDIASLKKQLAELEVTKQTQEKFKAELEDNSKFDGWKPTKNSVIQVIKLASKNTNLKFFKNLRYPSGIHDISYGNSLEFGDGWVIECKHSHGGGEGDGSERYVVLSVTQNGDNETLWYVPGYYESYNGSELELDSLYQVEPYEKMVTDYRKI